MAMTLITTAEHDAIEVANRRFADAFTGGDIPAAVDRTYTRDATVLPPGADRISGRGAIREFWPAVTAQLGVSGIQLETVELRPMGEGICEIGRGTLTFSSGVEQVVKYVVMWKQEDGEWRIDVDMWN